MKCYPKPYTSAEFAESLTFINVFSNTLLGKSIASRL